MAEVDVSSYRQPQAAPKSMLDTVGQLGGIEQQKQQIERTGIAIDQDKLKLANERWGILNKELSTLMVDPNLTPDKVHLATDNLIKMNLIPPDMAATFKTQIPSNPADIKTFLERTISRAQTIQDAINYAHGTPGTINTGSQIVPTLTSPRPGFGGIRGGGPALPIQLPPIAEEFDPRSGGTIRRGVVPPETAPGAEINPLPPRGGMLGGMPGMAPGERIGGPADVRGLPVTPIAPVPPVAPAAARRESPTSPPALWEEGKKQFVTDQEIAAEKLAAIKPALQALPYMKDLKTGPGTEGFNKAIAFMKNWIPGIDVEVEKDPTVAYQIVNKKLADYLRQNPLGQRSDNAQLLSKASSPDPTGQLNQALVKLTHDAIGLDRLAAVRSMAFTHTNEGIRNEFHKYGTHKSEFAGKFDERVLRLDIMEPEEKTKLFKDMYEKKDSFEGKKFWRSLGTVDKLELLDTN